MMGDKVDMGGQPFQSKCGVRGYGYQSEARCLIPRPVPLTNITVIRDNVNFHRVHWRCIRSIYGGGVLSLTPIQFVHDFLDLHVELLDSSIVDYCLVKFVSIEVDLRRVCRVPIDRSVWSVYMD